MLVAGMYASHLWAAPKDAIVLKELGSFYVKGRSIDLQGLPQRSPFGGKKDAEPRLIDPNGQFEFQQVYVQFAKLARPRHRLPLVLWHGGSLSGAGYESTPDGRAGWQSLFLRGGYTVYVVDAFQGGRASWARYPEINLDEPAFRNKAFLWETFRVGPPGSYSRKESYAGTRFPVKDFDQFAMHAMPRFTAMPEIILDTLTRTIERVGPCILVAHSASGPFALRVARARPDLVKGVVAIEPSGGIDLAAEDIDVLARIPHLFLWGDNLATESWQTLYRSARRYADALESRSKTITWIDLPSRGVRGNSHMLMLDDNSDDVALLIAEWAGKHERR